MSTKQGPAGSDPPESGGRTEDGGVGGFALCVETEAHSGLSLYHSHPLPHLGDVTAGRNTRVAAPIVTHIPDTFEKAQREPRAGSVAAYTAGGCPRHTVSQPWRQVPRAAEQDGAEDQPATGPFQVPPAHPAVPRSKYVTSHLQG